MELIQSRGLKNKPDKDVERGAGRAVRNTRRARGGSGAAEVGCAAWTTVTPQGLAEQGQGVRESPETMRLGE